MCDIIFLMVFCLFLYDHYLQDTIMCYSLSESFILNIFNIVMLY